jgi:hypothetical protein
VTSPWCNAVAWWYNRVDVQLICVLCRGGPREPQCRLLCESDNERITLRWPKDGRGDCNNCVSEQLVVWAVTMYYQMSIIVIQCAAGFNAASDWPLLDTPRTPKHCRVARFEETVPQGTLRDSSPVAECLP